MKPQQTAPLKEQLEDFYASVEPSPAFEDGLLEGARRRRRKRRIITLLSGAAAAAIAVALGLLAVSGDPDVTELALNEVAKNHLKGVAPEVLSGDYGEVQEHLSRLDFPITPPADGLVVGYDLVGGRYCKVQGEFAAQLKLRPQAGGPAATAYIVPAAGVLAELQAAEGVVDGVRVRCRRTGEILVFLAESVLGGHR